MADSFRRWLPGWFTVLAVVLFASSARADAPKASDRAAARALARARAQADAPRWKDVASITLDIALQVPGTDTGRDAVQLYFEAFNQLVRQDPLPTDIYKRLDIEIPKLVAGCCRPDDIPTHPEPCGTFIQIQLDLQRVPCTFSITPERVKTPEEIQSLALQDAESRVKLWHDIGEPLCAAKNATCEWMAGRLQRAIYDFQTAHRAGRAMEIRRILIDPRHGIHKTMTAQLALFAGAQDLEQSLLDFEEAALWYERFARESPSESNAPEALTRAVKLRLLLNDESAAKRDMKAFEEHFGNSLQATAGRIALTIAGHALRAQAWKNAEAWLERKKALFERIQDIDVRIIFHTYQARIALKKGRTERAFAEYDVVRRSWKDAPAGVKRIEAHPSVQSLETILEAVGEAEFFFAKRAERAVDEVQFPAYRGPIEEKTLLQYVNNRRKQEIKKLKAIEHASQEYEKVLHIEPVAPPRWIIAAANRVGTLWATFADDAENIPKLAGPVPGHDGVTYEELRKVYASHVGPPPWRERAKEAFKFCVMHAVRSKHFDENARHCEQWLARHEPSPRRVADELHDTPSRSAFRIETRPIQ